MNRTYVPKRSMDVSDQAFSITLTGHTCVQTMAGLPSDTRTAGRALFFTVLGCETLSRL
jgi:hypothetical protein